MIKNGFTLVEIMVVVSVIAVLLTGGTMVMFSTLGSRGQNQADVNINQAGSQVMEAIEQNIRFAQIENVGANDRTDCLASSSGAQGSTLSVSDPWGTSVYSLSGNRMASTSGSVSYLSTAEVVLSDLEFTWICFAGAYDKVRISFSVDDPGIAGGVMKRVFERDVNMYNSGI